jgi:nitroreductase
MTDLVESPSETGEFDLASVDRLLTTTRSVRRRLDLDRPVDLDVVRECISLALQAPNADNQQNWRWLVVTDPDLRKRIGDLYRHAWSVHSTALTPRRKRFTGDQGTLQRRAAAEQRNMDSGQWLGDHIADVPVLVLPCVVGRPPTDAAALRMERVWSSDFSKILGTMPGDEPREHAAQDAPTPVHGATYWGSIYPAVWSFQLALRSRGLGSAITTTSLPFEERVAKLLGIPRIVTQICLLPVAHTVGQNFVPAPRRPVGEVAYLDRWETSIDG